ncbi:MAG: lactonase family protein [Myxococcales bacterium]
MRRLLAIVALALAAGGCSKAREIPGVPAPSAAATADRNLFGYVLDGAGGFAPLPGSPFASGGKIDDVESLSALTSRNLLFVGNDVTSTFSVLRFDAAQGALVPLAGSPYQSEGTVTAETGATGDFLFVGNATSNTVSSYRLRDDGVPLVIEGSPVPTGGDLIEGMTVDPLGRFVFVASANSNTLSVLRIAADGTLTHAPGSPNPGVFLPDEVALDPAGRLVYVTNRSQATISAFTLASDGRITPVPGSPFPAPAGFGSHEHCLVDRTGTLLIATYEAPPAISSYRIAQNGTLTQVPGTPVLLNNGAASGGPEGMAFDPTGRFLYVADHIANRLHVFAVDPAGGLSAVVPGGTPLPAEPLDVIIPGWQFNGRTVMFVATVLH